MWCQWSSGYDTHLDSKRLGFDSPLRHRIFKITNCHLVNLLLNLAANVITELKMHEDMLFSQSYECDSNQVFLAVMTLNGVFPKFVLAN